MSTDDRTTPPGRDRAADLERLATIALECYPEFFCHDQDRAAAWLHIREWDRPYLGAYLASLVEDLPAYLRREWAARKGVADHAAD